VIEDLRQPPEPIRDPNRLLFEQVVDTSGRFKLLAANDLPMQRRGI
jgi:hypothetical protein